jgi:hypothetical protein
MTHRMDGKSRPMPKALVPTIHWYLPDIQPLYASAFCGSVILPVYGRHGEVEVGFEDHRMKRRFEILGMVQQRRWGSERGT